MKKTGSLTLKILCLLSGLGLVVGGEANADGLVRADFVMQANDALFAAPEFEFSSLLAGSQAFALPDSNALIDDVPVRVIGITAAVGYQFETPAKSIMLGAEFPLVSKKLAARVDIARLEVDAVVSRQVGAVKVNVHVRGACEKIPISLSGGATVIGSFRTGVDASGLPLIQMPWAETRWESGSWSVGEFGCSLGGASFAAQVRAGILNFLSLDATRESVGRQLRASVEERLGRYQVEIRKWFLRSRVLASGIRGVSLVLNPRKIVGVRGENFQISGFIDFVFANPTVKAVAIVTATTSPRLGDASMYALFVPKGLPAVLSDMAFRTGFFGFRKMSQEIPPFLRLLDNGAAKVMIWPQLAYYSSAMPFFFDFAARARPNFGSLQEAVDRTLIARVSCSLDALLWAPKVDAPAGPEDFVKMVRFAAALKGDLRLALEPRADGADLNVNFERPEMSLSSEWESDYRPYLRSPFIGVETLRDNISSALANDGVRLFVPKLALTSVFAAVASGFALDGEWLKIEFH